MKPWLQLFRVPNLFTVPGDPLAGFLLASAASAVFNPALPAVILASLIFYGFGLLLNDIMDLAGDRAERPARPLPSGAVNPHTARKVSLGLVFAGLALCAIAGLKPLCCGAATVAAVISYNCYLKDIPFIGPVNMGLCRGLNVLLGASLAPAISTPALIAAALIAIYIMAVTLLSRAETQNPAIPPFIGKLIRALIFIQAFFCALSRTGWAGWAAAAILALALWPLSRLVGKRFYSS